MKKSNASTSLKYADAGVNLSAWHDTRKRIAGLVKSTFRPQVVGGFGQFGGLFDVSELKGYKYPILVSSVDGVGTKLKIAFETGIHDTVGKDIVNHCVDDILVLGAKPLFFLDYIGTGRLSPEITEHIVAGMAEACREAECVLIGGETAEMPGFYDEGEYDISGTIVGVVDREDIIDGSRICEGDVIIGLRSNGLHTNGYSLARKIVTGAAKKSYGDIFAATGLTFGRELLRPHMSYKPVLDVMRKGIIKGCAHLTGGGFQENIDRILPADTDAVIDTKKWMPDPIFEFLRNEGNVEDDEMYRTFNMGIGLVIVCDAGDAEKILNDGSVVRFGPVMIGRVEKGGGKVRMEY